MTTSILCLNLQVWFQHPQFQLLLMLIFQEWNLGIVDTENIAFSMTTVTSYGQIVKTVKTLHITDIN